MICRYPTTVRLYLSYRCDTCNTPYTYMSPLQPVDMSIEQCRTKMQEEGWVNDGQKILCPNHKGAKA